MTQITLERVSKSYAKNAHVVRDVDLDIGPGRFCVLLGPSGCGKSTLLRMVAGLETITSGEIRIDGARVNELAPARREVAMVFQNYALYPHMTVYDNMAFGLRQARMPAGEIDRRVREAGAVLQIEPLLDRQPKALSGGQRQRVAIGRAIVRQPKVFLFDEPLSNLDAALRVHMRTEIARLHREFEKASALYVTHDQTEAMALADQIVLLRAGREAIEHGSIAQVGTPMQLYHSPRDRFVAGFIGSPRMNLIPARVLGAREDAVTLQLELPGSDPVTIALPLAAPPAVGARVTFGIRPEHLVAPVPGAATLTRRVRQVEHFGDCSIVYLQGEGGEDIIAKVQGGCRSAPGETASYGLMPEHCHLFDANGFAIPRRVH